MQAIASKEFLFRGDDTRKALAEKVDIISGKGHRGVFWTEGQ